MKSIRSYPVSQSVSKLITLLTLLILVGCSTVKKPEIEIRYKTQVIAPADSLLVDCELTAPPDPVEYANLPSATAKEAVLIESNRKQLVNIAECNTRLKNLRKWKADQLKLYDEAKS